MARAFSLLVLLPLALLAGRERPPNIVFVLADDLGYGDLGCYGQSLIRTPNLDRMAAEGLRFTDFYAGSTVCAPSRCVLMTGLHLGHAWIRGNARMNLRSEDVTVAEVLKRAGYATGLFGKWGLGHEGTDGTPTRQGFDRFFGFLDQAHAHNYYPSFLVRDEERVALRNIVPGEGGRGQGVATERVDYAPDLIFEEALEFVRDHAEEPFFLYLAYTIPHANNEAGKEGMEVPELGVYADLAWPEPQKGHAAMVSRMDAEIGELLELLDELGIDEQTLVMFSSDNGPHREGGFDPQFTDSNGPLRGIKRSLHDGGIRVPMIARWPGRVPTGRTSEHVGYFGDLMATAADLAGVDAPEGLDSVSFVPAMLGRQEQQQRHEYLYWEFYERGSAQAARAGRWKAVRKPMVHGAIQLFDLSQDVGEEHDLAREEPEIVARMEAILGEAHVSSPRFNVPE